MTNKELQEELKKYPSDITIITGVYNHFTTTYGVIDHTLTFNPWEDLFGTPGKTDERLPDKDCLYLASEFPWKYGIGSEDINTPIWLVNGPDGDPDLVWKLNDFTWNDKINCWVKQLNPQQSITYIPNSKELNINNWTDNRRFTMYNPGIEDLRDGIRLCNLKLTIIA